MPPKPHPNPTKRYKIDHQIPNQGSELSLIPNFLNELVIEILSRLPAKSLLKFKCVSKSWLSLISSPRFIKTHLAIASGRDDYGHHALICAVDPRNGHLYFHRELYCISSLLYAPANETPIAGVIDIGHQMKCPGNSFVFVGSCNGLICIFNFVKKELFLWNPCIKKSRKLPDTGINKKHRCFETFGFGYDTLNDDYKVVGLFRFLSRSVSGFSEGSVTHNYEIKIYSLKNDSWSEMEDINVIIPIVVHWSEYFHYASGKLHWPIKDPIDDRRWKIGSFDLASQTYEEIDCPADCERNSLSFDIGVLGDCLSVFYKADVWVMKEYGVKDSWAKLVSIPYFDQTVEVDDYGRSRLVCLFGNGEILFVSGSVLSLYNPKRNTSRRFPLIGPLENVIMYVESLVSPDTSDVQ